MTETLSPALPDSLEQDVHALLRRLCAGQVRIGTAESCTGGLLASLFTDVPGLSHIFEAGLVVYSDAAKRRLLGIDPALLETEGAVSRAVAIAMAESLLSRCDIDLAIAVTGFAGPGEAGDEPGLVYLACAAAGMAPLCREEHFGDIGRGGTRIACIAAVVGLVNRALDTQGALLRGVPEQAISR